MIMCSRVFVIWFLALASHIAGQELVWQQGPPYPPSQFGAFGVNFVVKDAVGDINNDGTTDLLVWDQSAPSGTNMNAGYVAVLSGATGSTLYSGYGTAAGDAYQAVAALGDVSGDGIGDYMTNSATFGLRIHSGATGNVVSAIGGLPNCVIGVGDVSGDGFGDFAFGSAGGSPGPVPGAGYVTVYLGPMGTTPAFQSYGQHLWDGFGWSMSKLGDVNGDGIPDFVVGAPGVPLLKFVTVPGWAYVVSGADGSFIHQFTGPATPLQPHFGQVVAGIGDIDLDGRPDILVGAPDVPAVYVYSGGSGALITVLQVPWQSPNAFGRALRGLPDVDGDGIPDFAMRGQWGTGSVPSQILADTLIYSGATFNVLYSVDNILPEPPYYGYGWTFDAAGDVNGDGFQEIAISLIPFFAAGNTSKVAMISLKPSGVSAFGGGCPADSGLIPSDRCWPRPSSGSIDLHLSESAMAVVRAWHSESRTRPTVGWLSSGFVSGKRASPEGVFVSVDMFANGRTHSASSQMGAAELHPRHPGVVRPEPVSFYSQWADGYRARMVSRRSR